MSTLRKYARKKREVFYRRNPVETEFTPPNVYEEEEDKGATLVKVNWNSPQEKMEAILKAKLEALVLRNEYIGAKAPLIPQVKLYLSNEREILFGGAAGGGKSVGLLSAALMYVWKPGYRAIIIRRTFKQLSVANGIIDLSHQWLGNTDAKWNEQNKTWTFPSGAVLQFGHMEHENSKLNYQGAGYDFIGFDELTLFTETQYTYMFRSLGRRDKNYGVPTRMYSTSNPGSIGHEWVKARFVTPTAQENAENNRRYIPSSYTDNVYMDREDYEANLDQLDAVLRAQQKHGDWDTRPEGKMFKRDYFNYIEHHELPKPIDLDIVRFWDKAATEQINNNDPDYTAGILMAIDKKTKLIYIMNLVHFRADPHDTIQRLKDVRDMDGRQVKIRDELEGGSSGKLIASELARNAFMGYDYQSIRPRGSKVERAAPFQSQARMGHVYLVRGTWNSAFVDEFVSFPTSGVHDDIVDATSGAFNVLSGAYDYDEKDANTPQEVLERLGQANVRKKKVERFVLK